MARKGRTVDGILLLDKPGGMTSNHALQRAKRLFDARKAGHTGSLDPLATGLLPLCFGEATKVSGFLLDADKRYHVRARFGVRTDTGDAEGEVLERREDVRLQPERVRAAAAGFIGEIEQIPPMYSALKQGGRRLYELAREGVTVDRPARRVTIHDLAVLEVDRDEAVFDVHCSKGTYVRTLIEDIGDAAGPGAHVIALRRTALGPFEDAEPVSLESLEATAESGHGALDRCLLPLDSALASWPAVSVTEDMVLFLRQGQAVWVPRAPAGGMVRLYGPHERFLGMGVMLDDGRVAPRRLVARRGRG